MTGARWHRTGAGLHPPADLRRRFLQALPFPPDRFQLEAFDALDAGRSVLVSAPTGSGKTLVAAYSVHQSLEAGAKAFYTTPLKALSNQKYGEMAHAHGPERVGLLTGDTSVRADAPVVVMTTEVLRNMLLAGSGLLAGLGTVVLDEVHYLQDPYRGGVWEEVLVLTPPEVRFVCLSATVNNAAELGQWLGSIRGPTSVVVERERPITLRHHVAVYRRDERATVLSPLLSGDGPSDEARRIDQRTSRSRHPRAAIWREGRGGPRLPFGSPRRTDLIETLEDADLLPAIVFIFSRAACDDAVRQCVRDGLRLIAGPSRAAVRRIAEEHVAHLTDEDLRVLRFAEWLEGLESGIAAHHAGMVPPFREAVEQAFAAGHLRVVFATETLSLGINMPARTVVIERFTKFGAAGRARLTSGEYAQLTGRAGRRGLDDEGHAVVAWTPETALADVARVATAAPPDLHSAFRPTYNLAVNLVRRFDRSTALQVLRRSFAQWQAAAVPGRHGVNHGHDSLATLFGRRLAVLEELGYVDGWRLTTPGERLARIYHESDLLVAEIMSGDAVAGSEPSVMAGILSALVFERRRVRHVAGRARRPGRGTAPAATERPGRERARAVKGDRLGENRRAELAARLSVVLHEADRVRALEEAHVVPRTRQPEPGLAAAVASWARGASFATALQVAEAEVGEVAPGDFVRTLKQVADLAAQVSVAADDPATAAAAGEAARLLLRDVAAAQRPEASATADGARS